MVKLEELSLSTRMHLNKRINWAFFIYSTLKFCCYVTGTFATFSKLTPKKKCMNPCVSYVVNIDLETYVTA